MRNALRLCRPGVIFKLDIFTPRLKQTRHSRHTLITTLAFLGSGSDTSTAPGIIIIANHPLSVNNAMFTKHTLTKIFSLYKFNDQDQMISVTSHLRRGGPSQ